MMKVVWLPESLENLKKIKSYISKERPLTAEKVSKKIKNTVLLLEDNPNLGKPSLVEGFRQISTTVEIK